MLFAYLLTLILAKLHSIVTLCGVTRNLKESQISKFPRLRLPLDVLLGVLLNVKYRLNPEHLSRFLKLFYR